MSIESEVQYLLNNCTLPDGDELQIALPGTLNGGGFSNWDGIIAISRQGLFFSSEPGFVSNGAVISCGWAAVNWIKQEGATISAQVHMDNNQRRNISITVDNFDLDAETQTNAQRLVGFAQFCRANSVAVGLHDEFQRALACDEAEQALRILESVAAKDATSAVPHAYMAIHLTDLGRFGEAIGAIEQSTSRGLEQTAIAAWVHCRAHMANSEVPEAEREASRMLAELEQGEPMFGILPHAFLHGAALEAILLCQIEQEKWSLALQTSEALERVRSDDPAVHAQRCRIALEMGDLKLANASLATFKRSDAHDETLAMLLDAKIKWAKKERDAAIRLATDALKRAPKEIDIIATLLDWLAEAKQWESVVRIADQALAVLGEPNAYALMSKASALSELKKHQEALKCADEALRVAGPSDWLVHVVCRLTRADALSELGRHKDALVAVDATREFSKQLPAGDVLQQWKRQWEYFLAYEQAKALCGLERFQEALPLLRQASRLPPDQEDVLREVEKLQEEARVHLERIEEKPAAGRVEEADEQRGPSISGRRDETLWRLLSLQQKLEKDRRLAELAEEVRRLRDYYERPLTLAILGEFNAGKSTFINALLGQELLPTDVVPTTATINLLKFGDPASARLIWHDGSVEDIGMDRLRQYVVEQRTAAANDVIRRIKYVEVRQPHEVLKRIWIVDTPGLNAIIPEHMVVTREFVKQADAIVWLFRADQAGKKSEHEFLKTASGLASKSVGVLNHIDRVPAAEIPELLEGARDDFADVLSSILGVSARRALDGKVKRDQRLLDASGFLALERMLSEVFLSQSRVLKTRSTLQKADDTIATVEKIEGVTNAEFARQMTLTAEIKALVVVFQDETNKFIAELRREVEKTVLAATQTAASKLVALIQKHGRLLPFTDVKYLSGALQREIAPVFKSVADRLDDKAREQTVRLKKKWEGLGDLARHQKASALLAWFETDLEARLRENDMMIGGVSEYLRGRLDSGDLWDVAAAIPEERVQSVSAGELSELLRGRYSFVADGTIEKSQAWAKDLYATMTDLVERLDEELREQHDAERQEVFRPIIRMRPHFVVNAEDHRQ